MYFRSFLGKACTNNMVVTGFSPTGVLICKYSAADMLAGALIGPDNTIPMQANNGKTFVSSVLSQQWRQIHINGNLKIGMDPSSVCASPNTADQMRYNATNKKLNSVMVQFGKFLTPLQQVLSWRSIETHVRNDGLPPMDKMEHLICVANSSVDLMLGVVQMAVADWEVCNEMQFEILKALYQLAVLVIVMVLMEHFMISEHAMVVLDKVQGLD